MVGVVGQRAGHASCAVELSAVSTIVEHVFETTAEAVELLTCAQDQARVVAAAQERQTAALAQLFALRLQEDLASGANRAEAGEFAAVEIAVALCCSRRAAGELAALGMALQARLPATRRAWAAGELDIQRVRVIVERTQHVSPQHLPAVEHATLEKARTTPAGALGPKIDRIVLRTEPGAVFQRRVEATAERTMVVSPARDGMAEVWGRLPAVDGRVLDQRLDAMARAVCSDDPRTHAARRADALVALAAGTELACRCGCDTVPVSTNAARVQLVITASDLFGVGDQPGELVGHGPVDAPLVRSLASDADWLHATTDPVSGALIDLRPFDSVPDASRGGPGPTLDAHPFRYAPGVALGRLVRLRDGHCRFPGCGVPARRCDLDHREPFDHDGPRRGGRTVRDNLFCLCRFHHRAKTRGVWTYTHFGGGTLEWTSPTGSVYTTVPHDYGGTTSATA